MKQTDSTVEGASGTRGAFVSVGRISRADSSAVGGGPVLTNDLA